MGVGKQRLLHKAERWLQRKCGDHCLPVAVGRRGYVEYIAWVFKMKRVGKRSVWYLLSVEDGRYTSLKRICVG